MKFPTTTAAASSPAQGLFKFSLLTLLSVMTLAGLTSAIVFSRDWNPIERLLAAFWCAGLLVGVSLGRARGKHGIFSGGLGSALGSLIAIGIYEWGGFVRGLISESLLSVYLMFVIIAGWLLAVIAAATYHVLLTGIMECWWQQRWVRRTVTLIAVVCISAVIVWQLLSVRPWRPAWTLKVESGPFDDAVVEHVVSPQGDQVLTNVVDRGGFFGNLVVCQIHKLSSLGVVSQPFDLGLGHESSTFSPDGSSVASTHRELLHVFAIAGKHITFSEVIDHQRTEEPQLPPRFSPDGHWLRITTHTPRIQRLYTFDLTKKESRHIELFPFAGHLLISTDGRRLLKFLDPVDENGEIRLEIVDRDSWQTIARVGDIPQVQTPVFSLDGKRLAISDRIWKLPDGPPRNVGGKVIGLLTGERVLLKQQAADRWPGWIPDWLQEMPFVRRLHTHGTRNRLCVIDEATGKVFAASPWSADLDQVGMSANEKIVAACSRAGRVQIWKVPEQ